MAQDRICMRCEGCGEERVAVVMSFADMRCYGDNEYPVRLEAWMADHRDRCFEEERVGAVTFHGFVGFTLHCETGDIPPLDPRAHKYLDEP